VAEINNKGHNPKEPIGPAQTHSNTFKQKAIMQLNISETIDLTSYLEEPGQLEEVRYSLYFFLKP